MVYFWIIYLLPLCTHVQQSGRQCNCIHSYLETQSVLYNWETVWRKIARHERVYTPPTMRTLLQYLVHHHSDSRCRSSPLCIKGILLARLLRSEDQESVLVRKSDENVINANIWFEFFTYCISTSTFNKDKMTNWVATAKIYVRRSNS